MSSPEEPSATPSSTADTSSHSRHALTKRQRRVALACQRCKTRKQRCDGALPACASCAKVGNNCVYLAPQIPGTSDRREHIRALEERVAELETSLASYGASDVGDDHFRIARLMPGDVGEVEDGNEVFVAIRDLSLAASGHYVGGTSNIAIGRVLNSVVQSQQSPPAASTFSETIALATKPVDATRLEAMVSLSTIDDHTADQLIQGWFRHIATRYPICHTPQVKRLHARRRALTSAHDKCILHLIYAVSGRWLESAGETGYFFSDKHYDIAFQEMDSTLRLRDARSLDYLLLMTLYCTRAPREPGAWTYVGMAIRLCIELGLHRHRRERQPSIQSEMNRRRFWTAYFLERDICIAIGRPPSISDHDIDADLPFDINESVESDEVLRREQAQRNHVLANPPTNLTPFIHRTRLKRIESEIQHTVYRVDQVHEVSESVIAEFLGRLEQWRSEIPVPSQSHQQEGTKPYDGTEFFTIHYHRCIRFLLYPRLTTVSPNMHYLRLCADACAGVISDYRQLHRVFPVGFSALSIQSVFLAGLTWIYCAWLAPAGFFGSDSALSDCQLLLYVIAERYPAAKKYRDIFERLRSTVINMIHAGKHQPGQPVQLDSSMHQDFANLGDTWPFPSDFAQIFNSISGQNLETATFDPAYGSIAPAMSGEVGLMPYWPAGSGSSMQGMHSNEYMGI